MISELSFLQKCQISKNLQINVSVLHFVSVRTVFKCKASVWVCFITAWENFCERDMKVIMRKLFVAVKNDG